MRRNIFLKGVIGLINLLIILRLQQVFTLTAALIQSYPTAIENGFIMIPEVTSTIWLVILVVISILAILSSIYESITMTMVVALSGYGYNIVMLFISIFMYTVDTTKVYLEMYSLGIEMTIVIMTIAALVNIKPYFIHDKLLIVKKNYSFFRGVIDIGVYLGLIILSIYLLVFISNSLYYIVLNSIAEYAPAELMRLLTEYFETNLGYLTIMGVSFGIVAYMIHNLGEPLIIFLSKSTAQAKAILDTEYRKTLAKERRFIIDVKRLVNISLLIIIPIVTLPIILIIIEEPTYFLSYLFRVLYDFTTFNYTVPKTSIDTLVETIFDIRIIELYKEKIEEIIRFFLYLLF